MRNRVGHLEKHDKVDISAVPSIFGLQILALAPTQFMELLLEC